MYVTIKLKCLSQRFEESFLVATGRSDVFNIVQKRSNTVVPLKIDAAVESLRSYKGMRSR